MAHREEEEEAEIRFQVSGNFKFKFLFIKSLFLKLLAHFKHLINIFREAVYNVCLFILENITSNIFSKNTVPNPTFQLFLCLV
jgi:hypothetical protein